MTFFENGKSYNGLQSVYSYTNLVFHNKNNAHNKSLLAVRNVVDDV